MDSNLVLFLIVAVVLLAVALLTGNVVLLVKTLKALKANQPLVNTLEERYAVAPRTVQMPVEGFKLLIDHLANSYPNNQVIGAVDEFLEDVTTQE